ncbi:hypothetical protein H2203_006355 [Taxawa tesnikishii (nom. ined.)]|nr:hypothetical protein H2203_006355 [Dothideales sp. JES 119]
MVGTKPWPEVPVGNKDHANAVVLIIGAGISGMCTAIDLLKRNKCQNFIIVEKSSGVGGTWHDNKYPGCCCDVWSMLYSYSFEQNSDWTREYPGQEEILSYLMHVAGKYNLYQHIRFNTAVESARWDDEAKKWKTKVSTAKGSKDAEFNPEYEITSDFLVSAVGQLNVPRYPDNIPGLESFPGKVMHSARWDWSYDLTGKKIAVIGNEIAKVAKSVTIFQRSPNWVIPREDAPSFYDAVIDGESAFAGDIRKLCTDQMHKALPNQPELWEKLTPNYNPGCKRVIISDDYYPTLAQDHVRLETRPIARVTGSGIDLQGEDGHPTGGEPHYDLIVCATGFKTTEFMHPINFVGLAGRPLSEIWEGGARAFKGTTVEDLPNFGMFAQTRQDAQSAAKKSHIEEYNAEVQKILQNSSFADPNCNSWYKRKDTGLITNNWSGTVIEYQENLSKVNWDDYEIEGSGSDVLSGKKETKIGRVYEETRVSDKTLTVLGANSSTEQRIPRGPPALSTVTKDAEAMDEDQEVGGLIDAVSPKDETHDAEGKEGETVLEDQRSPRLPEELGDLSLDDVDNPLAHFDHKLELHQAQPAIPLEPFTSQLTHVKDRAIVTESETSPTVSPEQQSHDVPSRRTASPSSREPLITRLSNVGDRSLTTESETSTNTLPEQQPPTVSVRDPIVASILEELARESEHGSNSPLPSPPASLAQDDGSRNEDARKHSRTHSSDLESGQTRESSVDEDNEEAESVNEHVDNEDEEQVSSSAESDDKDDSDDWAPTDGEEESDDSVPKNRAASRKKQTAKKSKTLPFKPHAGRRRPSPEEDESDDYGEQVDARDAYLIRYTKEHPVRSTRIAHDHDYAPDAWRFYKHPLLGARTEADVEARALRDAGAASLWRRAIERLKVQYAAEKEDSSSGSGGGNESRGRESAADAAPPVPRPSFIPSAPKRLKRKKPSSERAGADVDVGAATSAVQDTMERLGFGGAAATAGPSTDPSNGSQDGGDAAQPAGGQHRAKRRKTVSKTGSASQAALPRGKAVAAAAAPVSSFAEELDKLTNESERARFRERRRAEIFAALRAEQNK